MSRTKTTKTTKAKSMATGENAYFPIRESGFSDRWVTSSGRVILATDQMTVVLRGKEVLFVPTENVHAKPDEAERAALELNRAIMIGRIR